MNQEPNELESTIGLAVYAAVIILFVSTMGLGGCSVNTQQMYDCEVKCQHNQGVQAVDVFGNCECLDGAQFSK